MVPAYYQRGIILANLGRFAELIEDFNQVIRLNPQDPMAYNNRGAAREQSGDLDGAITDYQEALRIYPALELAMNNLRRAQAKYGSSQKFAWVDDKYGVSWRLNWT